MPQFTSLVRPFQTRDTAPGRNVPPETPEEAKPNIILQYGKGAGIQTGNLSYNMNAKWFMTKVVKEK